MSSVALIFFFSLASGQVLHVVGPEPTRRNFLKAPHQAKHTLMTSSALTAQPSQLVALEPIVIDDTGPSQNTPGRGAHDVSALFRFATTGLSDPLARSPMAAYHVDHRLQRCPGSVHSLS